MKYECILAWILRIVSTGAISSRCQNKQFHCFVSVLAGPRLRFELLKNGILDYIIYRSIMNLCSNERQRYEIGKLDNNEKVLPKIESRVNDFTWENKNHYMLELSVMKPRYFRDSIYIDIIHTGQWQSFLKFICLIDIPNLVIVREVKYSWKKNIC